MNVIFSELQFLMMSVQAEIANYDYDSKYFTYLIVFEIKIKKDLFQFPF